MLRVESFRNATMEPVKVTARIGYASGLDLS